MQMRIDEICNSISEISVDGITFKDKNDVAASWIGQANIFYPNPNQGNFITNFNLEYDSVLQGASAPMTISYTLNYVFLYVQIGDLSGFTPSFSEIVTRAQTLIEAIVDNPAPYSGQIEMKAGAMSVGPVQDPVGNFYHGAEFSLNIVEMQN